MTREQEKQVIDALIDFVIRVSRGDTENGNEIKVLPAVATLLLASNNELRF